MRGCNEGVQPLFLSVTHRLLEAHPTEGLPVCQKIANFLSLRVSLILSPFISRPISIFRPNISLIGARLVWKYEPL